MADGIAVEGADAVTLVLAAATSFKNFQDITADPSAADAATLAAAVGKPFDACAPPTSPTTGACSAASRSTWAATDGRRLADRRAARVASPGRTTPQLAALYFQYGRYLLIASSRPGGQPANLQGIWNDSSNPPWDSKCTVQHQHRDELLAGRGRPTSPSATSRCST